MADHINIDNESLDAFLKNDLGDFLETTNSINETVEAMSLSRNDGNTELAITTAIEDFLTKGSSVLDTMTIYCNNMPDAESVSSMASLITSLSGAINNIANLYKLEQNHKNKLELEEKKHELKLKEIEFREITKAKVHDQNNETYTSDNSVIEDMHEFNTLTMLDQIIERENKVK